ncbi:3-hydroxybutyrate dehydrogenase [Niabella aurantiaca]|uniref:3-hydroxybutyrate dehydrogenase n=1 Tax=Niabella aurantiaca TaxID=379900 RepID=UPI00035DEBA8|nr:3-hydroxybutyrate dehydrogenase [Niabella aurantiaca]
MENKIAIITGAASGIGFEIARVLAAADITVVLADLDGEQAQKKAGILCEKGAKALGLGCDVTDEKSLESSIQYVADRFGRLDIFISNAGLQHISRIEAFPSEKFEQLIKVMLTGPFYAIKHVFPIMKRQRFGRIINMSSINGLIGFPGKAAYNSAKHGVIGLTKVAALEGAAFGITVNAVCPGYVDTPLVQSQLAGLAKNRGISVEKVLEEVIYPLVPQKRLLNVEEVAEAVLFLTGENAKGITGQSLVIDGGYTAQ